VRDYISGVKRQPCLALAYLFSRENLSFEPRCRSEHNDAHRWASTATAVTAACGVETRARGGYTLDASECDAREAFPGLSLDVVVSHVLREENLPHPADLAVLRAVSLGIRHAVDATERRTDYPQVENRCIERSIIVDDWSTRRLFDSTTGRLEVVDGRAEKIIAQRR